MTKESRKTAERLAELIEENPKCEFNIDNDGWTITKHNQNVEIANSDEFDFITDWYAHGNCYGAALAEALVIIMNKRGFEITASAV